MQSMFSFAFLASIWQDVSGLLALSLQPPQKIRGECFAFLSPSFLSPYTVQLFENTA